MDINLLPSQLMIVILEMTPQMGLCSALYKALFYLRPVFLFITPTVTLRSDRWEMLSPYHSRENKFKEGR
jgi:hypothetical protein